jgi:signal transduction histidine kinase
MPPTGAPENQANGTEDSGADLDPAVATRAYGSLHGLILETAAKLGIEVSLAEQKTLVLQVNETVARALAGYVRNQERELHRVAHELRNPLGSAMMALTLLRSRVDLGDHIRLAEMLERNLHRLEQGLDDALARRQRDEGGKAALDR